jgi:hypothetical protein
LRIGDAIPGLSPHPQPPPLPRVPRRPIIAIPNAGVRRTCPVRPGRRTGLRAEPLWRLVTRPRARQVGLAAKLAGPRFAWRPRSRPLAVPAASAIRRCRRPSDLHGLSALRAGALRRPRGVRCAPAGLHLLQIRCVVRSAALALGSSPAGG